MFGWHYSLLLVWLNDFNCLLNFKVFLQNTPSAYFFGTLASFPITKVGDECYVQSINQDLFSIHEQFWS